MYISFQREDIDSIKKAVQAIQPLESNVFTNVILKWEPHRLTVQCASIYGEPSYGNIQLAICGLEYHGAAWDFAETALVSSKSFVTALSLAKKATTKGETITVDKKQDVSEEWFLVLMNTSDEPLAYARTLEGIEDTPMWRPGELEEPLAALEVPQPEKQLKRWWTCIPRQDPRKALLGLNVGIMGEGEPARLTTTDGKILYSTRLPMEFNRSSGKVDHTIPNHVVETLDRICRMAGKKETPRLMLYIDRYSKQEHSEKCYGYATIYATDWEATVEWEPIAAVYPNVNQIIPLTTALALCERKDQAMKRAAAARNRAKVRDARQPTMRITPDRFGAFGHRETFAFNPNDFIRLVGLIDSPNLEIECAVENANGNKVDHSMRTPCLLGPCKENETILIMPIKLTELDEEDQPQDESDVEE